MYFKSVIPLYIKDAITKKYESIGSAILITHKSNCYFITAAHVLEAMKKNRSFYYYDQILYEIGNLPAFTSDLSFWQDRNNDPIDLGIIPLPNHIITSMKKSDFISYKQYTEGEQNSSNLFQALGYPHAKNTKLIRKTFNIPGGFLTEGIRYTVNKIDNEAFPHKNFVESTHIATCLTKTGESQGSRVKKDIPDLHGMSGGLLQKVSMYNQKTDGFDVAYPAGIILEKKIDNTSMYSLRLELVFRWIDLNENMFSSFKYGYKNIPQLPSS